MELPKGQAGFRVVFREYKKDARKRGLKFELTLKEFIEFVTANCFYCGEIPRKTRGTEKGTWIPPMNGVDRVSSDGGYYKENCVSCCKVCNRAKGRLDLSEFIDKVVQIYKKWFT